MKLTRHSLFVVALFTLLLTPIVCQAQPEYPKRRLRPPVTIHGGIGGEAQDRYVIRARKGQTLTVQLSWRKEGDNTASFSITPDNESGESLIGQSSDDGKRWTGKIPRTGNYLLSVMAHPSARYTLRVRLK